MKIKYKQLFLVFTLSLLIISCSDNVFYTKSYSFDDKTWNQSVKPLFKVTIKDTTKKYNFILTLRTTTDYEFSNCWIYLNSITPSKIKAREPFEIKTTNADGSWIGKKTGTIVEHTLFFKQRKFPQKGIYYFSVEQAVIQKNLNEVLDIGLRIEELEN
jgi:gliding motility-associated lipoprotein GldH